MPLYEYKCGLCGFSTEVLASINADAPICPKCTEMSKDKRPRITSVMVKQISRTSFSLKGEGWYKDHYGLKPSTNDSQE